MANSKIPRVRDTRFALGGETKVGRFASSGLSGNNVTLRWYFTDTDYYELTLGSTGMTYRKIVDGVTTNIWTK